MLLASVACRVVTVFDVLVLFVVVVVRCLMFVVVCCCLLWLFLNVV